MIRGIYTAAAGLATATLRLGTVSNNIANASTPGYKQDRLPDEVGSSIDLLKYAVDDQGRPVGTITLGPKIGLSQLDLTAGPIQETSNPLDLAIAGTGFFAVQAAFMPMLMVRCERGTVQPSWTPTARRSSSPRELTFRLLPMARSRLAET